uniref:Tandem kinase 1 n=1 Tax=Triticum dicoccoides TaxID=85692 RepID=A0A2Z5GZM3_TRIDC|nr:wheat tandem kinase 1 [Triticum dicoccoides]QAV53813.1 wheat tandem kinase 1 [Triticum dicoccoides]QAV53814.1 wheat tandem kinase 1 [Triticum dicoccoides]QJE70169.1 wheat tandem kinase 1 [Triticum dicoccoides]QJE70170.1 wheat tandem kinase 1 [Triticum dicoccoides]
MDYQGNNFNDFFQTNGHFVLKRVDNNYKLRSFTEKEIEHITDRYSTSLGNGSFGDVYKGRLDDQRPVAVKRYKNGTKKEEFAKEVIVHSQINHKNVVRLLGCCTEENALMIVMEFICNGNLYNILHCGNADGPIPFPLDKRLDIAIESAEALSCMHSMYSPVLHGDIKPANILLDEKYLPKLSDFGIARLLSTDEAQRTKTVIGCIGYVDPLFCQSGILTTKSDVYSFGVVLLEMITRKKATDGATSLTQCFAEALGGKKVRQLFDVEIANDKKKVKLIEDIAKLAATCLKLEDKMRPTMVEVADRLRRIRKALPQRKGESSTGINNGLIRTGKAEDLPTISLDEMKKLTRNFSDGALIGESSQGRVLFEELSYGKRYAFKSSQEIDLKIEAISRLKHKNVVQLLGNWVEGNKYVLAYEYVSGGTLHDILHREGDKGVSGARPGAALSWMQRVKIALSAAEGLEFLHQKAEPQVTHGNIMSSKILLFDKDNAKVGGVGISNVLVRDNMVHCHSFRQDCDMDRMDGIRYHPDDYYVDLYAATGQCNAKSDVYAFGVVLLELLTGREAVDHALPKGKQSLVTWVYNHGEEKSPWRWENNIMEDNVLTKTSFSEDMVQRCVDPRLKGYYHRSAVTKMGAIASLCVNYNPDLRPNMSTVVKGLRQLLQK